MNKKVLILIGGFLIFLLVICLVILNLKSGVFNDKDNNRSLELISSSQQRSQSAAIQENNKLISNEVECKDGWLRYQHDVIGISFCYPREWGEPVTEPSRYITKLEGVVDKYSEDEHNSYSNSIYLKFTNKANDIRLRFFNENYGGQYYPNAYAYEKGYIDNIAKLKSSGSICDYQINFTKPWKYKAKMIEIWSECDYKTKDMIIAKEQYLNRLNKTLFSYDLKSLAYKKLQNGYFDNLMVTREFGHISQDEKEIKTFDQYLKARDYPSSIEGLRAVKKKSYFEEREEFGEFIDSLGAFKPQESKITDLEIVTGEDQKITKIRKYYWLLSAGKLKEAYQMCKSEKGSFDDLYNWYANTKSVKPRDFEKLNEGKYKFFVDYQDHNESPTVYRIIMKVDDNKIETISTEEIVTEMKKRGNVVAYVKKQNNKSFVVLEKNNREIIIDQGEADYDKQHNNLKEVKFFRDVDFSPKGDFLMYTMSGWEWTESYVYDIKKEKNVLKVAGPQIFKFTPDGGTFYHCGSAGMASEASGAVYEVPSFKERFNLVKFNTDLKENIIDVDCEYNKEKNSISFTYNVRCEYLDSNSKEQCKDKKFLYLIDKDEVIEID